MKYSKPRAAKALLKDCRVASKDTQKTGQHKNPNAKNPNANFLLTFVYLCATFSSVNIMQHSVKSLTESSSNYLEYANYLSS